MASLHNRNNHVIRLPNPTRHAYGPATAADSGVDTRKLARLTPGKPESPLHFRVWSDQQLSYLAEAVAEKLGVATESIGFKDGHENALTTVLRIEELDLCGAWFNEGYGHRVEAIIPE
ncbi:hypothetical protein FN846DRAFT_892432 [Sphaerosporella brunnea]|uniref:Uncharacterized protein n=1 Tax=Sphaerosporella brunnea TaxID=1250544 RepID=A0A5J5EPU7_9PEZI|nr:hypothetical protein FN846DRAFT_892432 [Sphaerosporella brunnea]